MIKKEFVDIRRPIDSVNLECKKLESMGFIVTGQGGDEDDYWLVYENYRDATELEKLDILKRSSDHEILVNDFWMTCEE